MTAATHLSENYSDMPGMLDRLIETNKLTGNMDQVIQVIRGLHGNMDALKETLHVNPLDPQSVLAQKEAHNNAAYLAAVYQEALHLAEQTHAHILANKKKILKAQKRHHWLSKFAKLLALFSAYLAIDYQLQKEEDEKFQDYLKQKAEGTHVPLITKAIQAMSELIAHAMALEGPREKAVQIVATTFVVTETVNRAMKLLANSADAHVKAFVERLDQNDGQGKTALISMVSGDILTRNEREDKLRDLLEQSISLSAKPEEAVHIMIAPPAPALRPAPLDLDPRMDMLLEIKLMGLLNELASAAQAPDLKARLKIKSRLLEAMNDTKPHERLLEKVEQDIQSVGRQMLTQMNTNDILQNQLAPQVTMPSFNRSKTMTAMTRPPQPTARPVLVPTVSEKKEDELEENLRDRKNACRG